MYQLLESHDKGSERARAPSRLDAIQQRAWKWLGATDRAVLELSLHGTPQRVIAGAVGLSPGSVSRRLAGIQSRLRDPLTRLLLDPACPVNEDARQVVLLHQLTGLSTRRIAYVMGIPHTLVQSHLSYARGLVRGLANRSASRA